MRTTLSVVALAAGALAVPYKRDVVYTDYDVVYVTDVVTVTAGQAPAAYTPATPSAEPTSQVSIAQHYGHHGHQSAWATTWTEVVTQPSSSSTPAPVYTPETTSTPEPSSTPEPETHNTPSTTSTPVLNIPATSYVPVPTSTYVAPVSSAAPAASAGSYNFGSGVDATYGAAVLAQHNLHRANHSSPDVQWDSTLYDYAMQTAKTCKYGHDLTPGGGGYGQNIAAGVDSSSIDSVITDMFYNGEEPLFAQDGCYGQANPDMTNFEGWGHFTQVVWKDTTHVACYTTTKDDCSTLYSLNSATNTWEPMGSDIPAYFTVCNYKNPGNYAGEYATNVGKPLGKAPVYASS